MNFFSIDFLYFVMSNPQNPPKVFAIGFNKTGTTSLASILRQFGLNTIHHGTWHLWLKNNQVHRFRYFDAFTDGQSKDFRTLDKMYPNSKFILNTRPLKSWLTSRWGHVEMNKIMKRSTWVQNQPKHVAHWALKRDDYHADVVEYFKDRTNDFSVIDLQTMSHDQVDSNLKRILSGIAKKIPNKVNTPRANSTSSNLKKKGANVIVKALELVGMPEEDWTTNTVTQHFINDKYPADFQTEYYNTIAANKNIWYEIYRKHKITIDVDDN